MSLRLKVDPAYLIAYRTGAAAAKPTSAGRVELTSL